MQLDQESLRRKNEELVQAFREKSGKQIQIQELYDKLKRRAMLGQVQDAASDAVDYSIQASVDANRVVDSLDNQIQQPQQPPISSDMQIPGMQQRAFVPGGMMRLDGHMTRLSNGGGTWSGFGGQEGASRGYRYLLTSQSY